jgi:putative oxidoreductase
MSNQTFAETATAPSAIPSAVTTLVPALGRVMISTLFILAGLSKLAAPAMTIGYIQSVGLPLPSLAYGIAAFIEIVGGITLLLGYRTRIVAGVLFVFALATAAVFHNHFGDQNQFIHSSRTSR